MPSKNLPGASGQLGLAPKTTDLTQGTGNGVTSAPKMGAYNDYRGITIRETGGTASATVRLFDGTDNTGTVIEEITLAASGTATVTLPFAVRLGTGIYYEKTGTGTIEGAVYYG